MELKDIELESVNWIDLEIRQLNQQQTRSQTKYNFQDTVQKDPHRGIYNICHTG
jgi:hypothetical protein